MRTRTTCLVAVALVMAGAAIVATSQAPWLLCPATPSLPNGLYWRTNGEPAVGSIVVFRVPDAAIRYKQSIGAAVDPGFLFMKPIIAGPGNHVCHRAGSELVLNGDVIAPIAETDRLGRKLPVWRGCQRLGPHDYFTFSNHVPNSFDSRHYGPIKAVDILGVYQPLLSFGAQTNAAPSMTDAGWRDGQ